MREASSAQTVSPFRLRQKLNTFYYPDESFAVRRHVGFRFGPYVAASVLSLSWRNQNWSFKANWIERGPPI